MVQDIFLTETAWLADVVLPASAWPEKTGTASNTDRMVQMGRRALNPPGDARGSRPVDHSADRAAGPHGTSCRRWKGGPELELGEESGVAAVYDEMRQAMHASIEGITWGPAGARLQRDLPLPHALTTLASPSSSRSVPHAHGSPATGACQRDPGGRKAERRVPVRAHHRPPAGALAHRQHDAAQHRAGRHRAHGHRILHGDELARLGVQPGALVGIRSRGGMVQVRVRRDDGTPRGTVFMPFAYVEAAANLLTNAALDPFGKIPEFKYCAVAVEALPSTKGD